MSGFTRLNPTPGIPWWERQPHEPASAYSRFLVYVEMDKGNRTIQALAERVGAKINTVRQQAAAYKWTDRAAAYDAEQNRLRRDRVIEQETRLSRLTMDIALASAGVLARSVKAVAETGQPLDPNLMPKWAKMVDTLHRVATNGPDQRLEITGAEGGPIQIAEFEGLSASERRERATEMAQGVLRLYQGGKTG